MGIGKAIPKCLDKSCDCLKKSDGEGHDGGITLPPTHTPSPAAGYMDQAMYL